MRPWLPGDPSPQIPCIVKAPAELTASLTTEQADALHAHYQAQAYLQAAAAADDGFNRGIEQGRLEAQRVEEQA